jgi:hypothetical protein
MFGYVLTIIKKKKTQQPCEERATEELENYAFVLVV